MDGGVEVTMFFTVTPCYRHAVIRTFIRAEWRR
jgi:hypothetical protein